MREDLTKELVASASVVPAAATPAAATPASETSAPAPVAPASIALIIPALNPEESLITLIDAIKDCWFGPIVLVDDGSAPEASLVFNAALERGCALFKHARNLGKGRALKTGFNACLVNFPEIIGAITADADGQHDVDDILACADALRANPDKLIVGCRDFSDKSVPTHNMLGNRITSVAMRLLCGVKVSDTQTGLRGISRNFMTALLVETGERFEFETNMLLATKRLNVEIFEVPIKTIYIEQNRTSNFRVFRDSLSIYLLLIKYALSSFVGSIVDLIMYALLLPLFELSTPGVMAITITTVAARVISATVNFIINRNVVFRSEDTLRRDAARYVVLCLAVMCASAGLVTFICALLPLHSLPVKIVVDFLLFFVNYSIQRTWVFASRK